MNMASLQVTLNVAYSLPLKLLKTSSNLLAIIGKFLTISAATCEGHLWLTDYSSPDLQIGFAVKCARPTW